MPLRRNGARAPAEDDQMARAAFHPPWGCFGWSEKALQHGPWSTSCRSTRRQLALDPNRLPGCFAQEVAGLLQSMHHWPRASHWMFRGPSLHMPVRAPCVHGTAPGDTLCGTNTHAYYTVLSCEKKFTSYISFICTLPSNDPPKNLEQRTKLLSWPDIWEPNLRTTRRAKKARSAFSC